MSINELFSDWGCLGIVLRIIIYIYIYTVYKPTKPIGFTARPQLLLGRSLHSFGEYVDLDEAGIPRNPQQMWPVELPQMCCIKAEYIIQYIYIYTHILIIYIYIYLLIYIYIYIHIYIYIYIVHTYRYTHIVHAYVYDIRTLSRLMLGVPFECRETVSGWQDFGWLWVRQILRLWRSCTGDPCRSYEKPYSTISQSGNSCCPVTHKIWLIHWRLPQEIVPSTKSLAKSKSTVSHPSEPVFGCFQSFDLFCNKLTEVPW